ncbi:hypothetical protein [Actinoplanes regularis]|uniref:hypothetical protein n=1 Tax=Actinoplanes regularis TaxID=52697 RepID=UPI002553BCD7|nr:hypothetical protein [Actinoplanes regularis]GLW31610.1 hypothetical protein Areg01_45500 [Actinoplanes regularis]
MEENEFRDALRTVLTQSPEPPPMQSSTAIAAGRRAARRRTVTACTGAVVALTAVVAVPALYRSGGSTPAGHQAAGPAPTPGLSSKAPANGVPGPDVTKPSWPAEASGDATADSGPHYQTGKKVLDTLLTVVPSGYEAPVGSAPDGTEFRSHQGAIEDPEWSYLASVKITKDGAAGQLYVEVHEPDNRLPSDPCELAESFWGVKAATEETLAPSKARYPDSPGGRCELVQVGKVQVAVAGPAGPGDRLDRWAAYRYDDGTVVFVAQARQSIFDEPKLPAAPFTAQQLAALAVDKRFHVGVA